MIYKSENKRKTVVNLDEDVPEKAIKCKRTKLESPSEKFNGDNVSKTKLPQLVIISTLQ